MKEANIIAIVFTLIILIIFLVGIWIDTMTISCKLYASGIALTAFVFFFSIFVNDDNYE